MATRTIPNNPRPWWECTVNGKNYRYRSGATVDVPDAVADVIDTINRANERPTATPDPVLPKITAADEGKVVKAVGGAYKLEEGSGGGGAQPMIVTMTPVEGDSEFPVFTADKTIAEIAAAYNALTPVYFRGGMEGIDHMPLIFAMYINTDGEEYGVAVAGMTISQFEGGDVLLGSFSLLGNTGGAGDVWMLVDWMSDEAFEPIGLEGTIGAGDSITVNKTARELFDLCEKGKAFLFVNLKDSEDHYLGEAVASITAMNDATGKYYFRASMGAVYSAAELNPNDPVVLAKAT